MAHAFISYSHSDERTVQRLQVHMAQLKREGSLTSWFDGEIKAGGELDDNIITELNRSDMFLAIISPDYLNSAYCYDVEFQHALTNFNNGKVRIVPIIAQPCDWKPSSFGGFKAIPKDGKPISEWVNENNAFLNVIDELRRLVPTSAPHDGRAPTTATSSKHYKVKRDFDPVDQLNFRDESFEVIHTYFRDAIEEINGVEQIKARFVHEQNKRQFTCVVTNRAKIGSTGYISIGIQDAINHFGNAGITYSLSEHLNENIFGNTFSIEHDDYRLFWTKRNMMYTREEPKPMDAKEIADVLWDEFIGQVGIKR